jgi:hypothetical protein
MKGDELGQRFVVLPGQDVRIERYNDAAGIPERWLATVNNRIIADVKWPLRVSGVDPFAKGAPWVMYNPSITEAPHAVIVCVVQEWQRDTGAGAVIDLDRPWIPQVSREAMAQIAAWAGAYVDNETSIPESPGQLTAVQREAYTWLQQAGACIDFGGSGGP